MKITLFRALMAALALVAVVFLSRELFQPRLPVPVPDSGAALSVPLAAPAPAPPSVPTVPALVAVPEPAPADLADWIEVSTRLQPEFGAFARWTGRWVGSVSAARTGLLQEGVALAEQRRTALRQMIPTDPRTALEAAVPYAVRQSLPAEVVARLEQPVAGGAEYVVSIQCGGDHGAAGHADEVTREVRIGDQTWASFTYADRLATTSKHGMSVHGIAVDEVMAMDEAPVRRLSAAEAAARGLSPAGIHVEMAGRIQSLVNEAALVAWTNALIEDERRLGPFPGPAYRAAAAGNPLPPAAAPTPSPDNATSSNAATDAVSAESTWTEGAKTMLYIRARFADEAAGFEPLSLGTAQSYQNVVDTFWQNASYGKTSLTTTFTEVVALPSNAAVYTNAFYTLLADARNAASAANAAWNTANFDLYVVVTSNKGGFGYAGYASVGSAGVHLRSDYASLRTAGHEYGHNLGLWHANYWRTASTSPIGQDSNPGGYVNDATGTEWIEYGHRFSLMSAQYISEFNDAAKPHYSVVEKTRLDWLTTTDGLTTLSSTPVTGTMVRMYRQDHPAAGNTRGLKIDQPSSDYTTTADSAKRRCWLSYRRAFNSGTPASYAPYGIEVDWSQPTYGSNGAIQLDMTPFTRNSTAFINGSSLPSNYWTIDNSDKEDGMLPMGLTYSDPAGIHFTPIAFGDDDATANNGNEWIEVDVRLGTFPGNAAPVVALAASTTTPAENGSVTFTATASDADGDALSYWWDFGDNSVVTSSFNSAAATKSWSSAGVRVVRVVVSDRKGGQTIAMLPVTVGSPANDYEICGRVLWGGVPVAGARVSIGTTYQTWTDSLGRYILAGLPSGSHTLACAKDGLTFTAQFSNPVSTATSSQYGVDFYADQAPTGGGTTYSISGTVTHGGAGLAGVAVEAGGLRSTTSGTGSYTISGLTPGTYTVTASQAPFIFTPSSRSVTLTSANSTGQDFSVVRYTVSGSFSGVPTSPLPTVFLLDSTSVLASKQGKNVTYSISVPAGTYHLCSTLAGYSISPSFSNPLTVTGNLSSRDFTAASGSNINSVSGRITFAGQPLAGVSLSLTGAASATTTTDSGGWYRFSNLSPTSSTVTPTKSGYVFSPVSSIVTPGVSTTADFVASGSGATAAPNVSAVTATPSSVTVPGAVTLAAIATGGGPLSYHWCATTAPGPVTFSTNDSPSATTFATLGNPGSYTFSAIVTNADGFTASRTVSVTATSSPATLVISPYEVSIPAGGTVDFNTAAFDTTGNALTLTPTFSVSGGGSINAATGQFTASLPGTHTVTATAGSLTATATVTVNASGGIVPPTITTQPQPQTATVGQAANISVAAVGEGTLTYQWQKSGAAIDGATSPTYAIASPVVADAGNYTVVVTNEGGSTISDPATLTVTRATPEIITAPVAAAITYGETLAEATLSGGTASVAGTFAFTTPATAPDTGTANHAVTFTPTDTANYNTTSVQVSVTVDKATPTITTAPVAVTITYGETLAEATLTGGTATVAGTFAFSSPATAPNAGTADHAVTFTPADTANYNPATALVSVTVDKATPTITIAPVAVTITYGETLAEATLTGGTASVAGTFAFTNPDTPPDVGTADHAVTFTPTDTANYNPTSVQVSVTVEKATPVITEAPVATAITYGETLAEAILSGGVATVAGTFAFATPTTAPDAGTADHVVTFTPTDMANYNSASVQVSVTVGKATPTITTAPVAAAITYGETLASATLSGGTASVAGTFAFISPTTAPVAGTANQAVTFTPTDTANYNPASVQVSVTVNKTTPVITTAPAAAAITYGETLAEASLSGGVATVAGTFAFASPTTAPNAGTVDQAVTFTPTDTANYKTATVQVSVTVDKAVPVITEAPVAAAITYGETLAEATLSGGVATVAGTFAFATPATAPGAGTANYAVTFTPTDTANYDPTSVQVSVTVDKATPVITTAPVAAAITYGETLAEATLSGGVATVAGTFAFASPATAPDAGTADHAVTFTPTDTANFNTTSVQVSVTVDKATPTITTAPVAAAITYGETLAEATLSGGTATVAGTFAFASPATAPGAGTANHAVTFTPTETANYNTTSVQVSVPVDKATPTIMTAPVAAAITYGETLAEAFLSGGAATVAGTFAFTSPATAPDAGTADHAVTFTPTDTSNYNPATVQVSVTVTENFAFWIGGFDGVGELTGPTDDPDCDGVKNLMEYALAGGDPGDCDSSILPVVSTVLEGNQEYLAITVRKNPTATGVSWVVEVSGDLGDWNAGAGHTVIVSETADTLVVRDHTPMADTNGRFLRLRVVPGQP